MIRLTGPVFADAGKEVCINAGNIGSGFQAAVRSGGRKLRVRVVIDPATDTAEICFVIPAGSEGAQVVVSNSSTNEPVTHTILT